MRPLAGDPQPRAVPCHLPPAQKKCGGDTTSSRPGWVSPRSPSFISIVTNRQPPILSRPPNANHTIAHEKPFLPFEEIADVTDTRRGDTETRGPAESRLECEDRIKLNCPAELCPRVKSADTSCAATVSHPRGSVHFRTDRIAIPIRSFARQPSRATSSSSTDRLEPTPRGRLTPARHVLLLRLRRAHLPQGGPRLREARLPVLQLRQHVRPRPQVAPVVHHLLDRESPLACPAPSASNPS